jgi:glutamate dehydrogenase/leucine dehydrogenase
VVQGFGNVGSWFAKIAHEEGARVVAVADHRGGVYSESMLDIPALSEYSAEHRTVKGFPGGIAMNPEDIFEVESDILVPAAIENVITEANASHIKTKLVLEAANHPTTPPADRILGERGIPVLPDVLVNAGGVTVSYFEWTQNLQQYQWDLEKVNQALKERMTKAYQAVAARVRNTDLTHREAALEIGIERVAKATELRGFVV